MLIKIKLLYLIDHVNKEVSTTNKNQIRSLSLGEFISSEELSMFGDSLISTMELSLNPSDGHQIPNEHQTEHN